MINKFFNHGTGWYAPGFDWIARIGIGLFFGALLLIPNLLWLWPVFYNQPTDSLQVATWGWVLWLGSSLLVGQAITHFHRLHAFYNMHPKSLSLANRYLYLPKSDRKLFPPNLIEFLKQDLSADSRAEIHHQMEKIFFNIGVRNANQAKHELERVHASIDDEPIISQLKQANEHLKIDIEIQREFL